MNIYRGILEYADGRIYDELWVNKEDAISYFSRADKFKGIVRAELTELAPGEGVHYEFSKCLYEYDVNGKYYYNVA